MICISVLVLVVNYGLSASSGLSVAEWAPQLGTSSHPKSLSLSPVIREGDIYKFGDDLFYAKIAGDSRDSPDQFALPDGDAHENYAWLRLEAGSFLWPKSLEAKDALWSAETGDLFTDERGQYFKLTSTEPLVLVPYNHRLRWLTSLRPVLGGRRLGDIHFPGSHDSGTAGMDDDSHLVDRNFFLVAADAVTHDTILNWSLTHDTTLREQLQLGLREFDLRVADVLIYNDTFRWWHGLAADEIFPGLEEIRDFARENPEELVICYFQHFVMPGNAVSNTRPIPRERKEELNDIFLSYLGDVMVPPEGLSDNPTLDEVLETGGSVMAIMTDSYIRGLDDRYWPNIVRSGWTGRANPEDLFTQRSTLLADFKATSPDRMSDASCALTPNEKSVVAGLMRTYGTWDNISDIIDQWIPGINEVDPEEMSFEGMFTDLLHTARDGMNSLGMGARSAEAYSAGASVHYTGGVADMYRHWLARPDKFKPNIVYIDDAWSGGDFVDTAIEANRGDIKREVSVAMQGSCRHGFYEWELATAVGGRDGYNCTEINARYRVDSESHGLHEASESMVTGLVTFTEGQYPSDTEVHLEVQGLNSETWYHLYSNNIQTMIEGNVDVYVRGNGPNIHDVEDEKVDWGFAYVSETYNLFGADCYTPPEDGFIQLVTWGENW